MRALCLLTKQKHRWLYTRLQCQLQSSQLNIKDYNLWKEMKLESLHKDIHLNIWKNNNTLPAVYSTGSKEPTNNIRSLLHYRCFSAWPGKTNAKRLFTISSVYIIEFLAPSAQHWTPAPKQIGDVVIIAVFIRHRPNCDSNTKIIFENSNEALQGLMNK